MAWKIHFNGQDFGLVSDADYQNIFDNIKVAASEGHVAEFGTEIGGVKRTAIWTEGAPISFEHVDVTEAD